MDTNAKNKGNISNVKLWGAKYKEEMVEIDETIPMPKIDRNYKNIYYHIVAILHLIVFIIFVFYLECLDIY